MIAGGAVRASNYGVRVPNVLTNPSRRRNPHNVVKAIVALEALRDKNAWLKCAVWH